MILCAQGFDVKSFTEPLEALQAVLTQPPDLLVTDVMMPLFPGIELAIRVREHYPHCNVSMFSGHSSAADLLEASVANGQVFEFLSKPAHPRDVLNKVREMIERVPQQTLVTQPREDCRPSPP